MRDHVLALMCVDGIGPGTYHDLLRFYGSAETVLSLPESEIRTCPLFTETMAESILSGQHLQRKENQEKAMRRHGAACVSLEDATYPMLLKQIHHPPPVLIYKGDLSCVPDFCLAMVGSRHPDAYGKEMARRLSEGLAAAGIPIVSGLARGIDTASHLGALAVNTQTIAVLGTPVHSCYPAENRGIYKEIVEKGLLLTEQLMDDATKPGNFIQRNRIISGLSRGVVVVQAAHRSGAITTALFANEQNRDVFAVPGDIFKGLNAGCHRLLKMGAKLVERPKDILSEYPEIQETHTGQMNWLQEQAKNITLDAPCQSVLDCLDKTPKHIDTILEECELSRSDMMTAILNLELKNFIRRHPGNYFTRSV